jgi:predicted hydrocarbon binding protein
MDAIAKSGHLLPNRFARITLQSIEAELGSKGLSDLLVAAHLSQFVGNYPPPSLEPGFDFADLSALNLALDEVYGARGGRGLALRIGRSVVTHALDGFSLGGIEASLSLLPSGRKLRTSLNILARAARTLAELECRVKEETGELHFSISPNPFCWGRAAEERPGCFMLAGVLEEVAHRSSHGREFRVNEAECMATGGRECRFIIEKKPVAK